MNYVGVVGRVGDAFAGSSELVWWWRFNDWKLADRAEAVDLKPPTQNDLKLNSYYH